MEQQYCYLLIYPPILTLPILAGDARSLAPMFSWEIPSEIDFYYKASLITGGGHLFFPCSINKVTFEYSWWQLEIPYSHTPLSQTLHHLVSATCIYFISVL